MIKKIMCNIKKIINNPNFINILMGILIPIFFIFVTEYIQTQSISTTFMWIYEHIGFVMLNYLLMYFIFWGIQLLFNKTLISYRLNCFVVSNNFFDFSFKIRNKGRGSINK